MPRTGGATRGLIDALRPIANALVGPCCAAACPEPATGRRAQYFWLCSACFLYLVAIMDCAARKVLALADIEHAGG